MKKIILSILFTSLLIAIENPQIKVYSENDVNITILNLHQKFYLKLPSNPSTGYIWKIEKYNQNILTLQKKEYKSKKIDTDNEILGLGGDEYWLFSIEDINFTKSEIIMEYSRFKSKQFLRKIKFNIYFQISKKE